MNEVETRNRAYKVCLDPNAEQLNKMTSFAGASRWAYNYALDIKLKAQDLWFQVRDEALQSGLSEKDARKKASGAYKVPNYMGMATDYWTRERDTVCARIDEETGELVPWWSKVVRRVFVAGFQDADTSFKNWMDSLAGKRKGRKVGKPRFHTKGKSINSFRIANDVSVVDTRHVKISGLGSIRTHSSLRRLVKKMSKDASIQVTSVTVSRRGKHWYASLLVKEPVPAVSTTKRQKNNGVVGVDMGVSTMASLSTSDIIVNPRWSNLYAGQLKKAQQELSRTQKGSNRRKKAARKVWQVHVKVSLARQGFLNQVTSYLTKNFSGIAIEDLNVSGMTRSGRGTVGNPGKNVSAKSGLNRSILDVGFGEFRRQLEYKAQDNGSMLETVDRFYPSSKTCSSCGNLRSMPLSSRTYTCTSCGFIADRDYNASVNIRNKAFGKSQALAQEKSDQSLTSDRGVPRTLKFGAHGLGSMLQRTSEVDVRSVLYAPSSGDVPAFSY